MKLKNITEINATLLLKTGLHIGAGDSEMQIGGIDSPVVKNPITNDPYVPGSSLKGKIRTLLEWRSGAVQNKPLSINDLRNNKSDVESAVLAILQLFGISADSNKNDEKTLIQKVGVARLAFWDCPLSQEWKNQFDVNEFRAIEAKYENTIDRITSATINGGLRQTERVPAGAKFDFKLTMREFEDDDEELLNLVLKGLRLLELDSLGGSGSRGYGKVEFVNLTVNGERHELKDIDPFAQ